MSQMISVNIQMDEKGFRDFAVFDFFRHQHAWQRPAVFAAILLVCSGICFSQVGKRGGAGLLTAVLAIVALGLPAAYFGSFFYNLPRQVKKLGLPKPFYRLELTEQGLSAWMAGSQDKAEPTYTYPWSDAYCAYRTADAVYLYVRKNQAFLLNQSTDAAWNLLQSALPAGKLHDCRQH